MKKEYRTWIENNCVNVLGKCVNTTLAMQEVFPELKRIRGHYLCHTWGKRQHWWLITKEGNVVDPTAKQFPSLGSGEYMPWVEGAEEPSGKCHECGEYTYSGKQFCSSCQTKDDEYLLRMFI